MIEKIKDTIFDLSARSDRIDFMLAQKLNEVIDTLNLLTKPEKEEITGVANVSLTHHCSGEGGTQEKYIRNTPGKSAVIFDKEEILGECGHHVGMSRVLDGTCSTCEPRDKLNPPSTTPDINVKELLEEYRNVKNNEILDRVINPRTEAIISILSDAINSQK